MIWVGVLLFLKWIQKQLPVASKDGPLTSFTFTEGMKWTEIQECFIVSNFLPLIWRVALKPSQSHVQFREMFENHATMVHCSSNRERMLCHSAGTFNQRNLGPIVVIQYCLLHLNRRIFHWSSQNVPACVPGCEVAVGRKTRVIYGL